MGHLKSVCILLQHFHTFNCKTLLLEELTTTFMYFVFVAQLLQNRSFSIVKNILKYLQHSQFYTLNDVFEAVPCMYTPHTIPTKTNLPLIPWRSKTRVSPSLYGQSNTKQEIAIECFNTNSKRSPRPLFFRLETPETRIGLYWCINQRF